MTQSLNMRHFPEQDPAPRHYSNEDTRREIASQVDEYLAKGGEIRRIEGYKDGPVVGQVGAFVPVVRLR